MVETVFAKMWFLCRYTFAHVTVSVCYEAYGIVVSFTVSFYDRAGKDVEM